MLRLLFLSLLISFTASAQKLPSIEEKVSGFNKKEGFITFYWEENAGKIWLEVDKMDKEF